MRDGYGVEASVGMAYYVSDSDGTGGYLRRDPAEFQVRELEWFDTEPVDADPGSYPHVVCRVVSRGWETTNLAGTLSDRLGVSRERVSWAGTKDKHAHTTQLFSVDGVDPDRLRAVEVADAELSVVGRAGRPILFGDLAGNEFEITVREPTAPGQVDAVSAELRAFAGTEDTTTDPADGRTTVAVPNYFGQQRFGSHRPVTHEVGLALLRDGWEAAVLAYVGNPSEREPGPTREARAYAAETRDWAGALKRFPDHLGHERAICERLADGAEAREALQAVPTSLQRLFVNAAQSYVFNRVLSERLRRGLPFHEPVEGDVVCFADRDAPAGLAVPDPDRTQRVSDRRLSAVRRHCERDRAFVTAPLVGTETGFAGGEPGDIERSVLDEVGVGPAEFELPDGFGSTGTRRAVLVRTALAVDRAPLTFRFSLPKGSYATTLLREYLKVDPDAL